MNTILLTRDGGLERQGEPLGGSVLPLLRCAVELAPGYTLRSFFRLLDNQSRLVELSEFLPSLCERVSKAPAQDCRAPGINALTLWRTVEMVGFPGKPRMEIYTSFLGVSEKETVEIRLLQVEDLLDTPLTLGPLRHVVLGDEVDIFEFETVYTLFEFIEGISWELSFHGAPMQCKLGNDNRP